MAKENALEFASTGDVDWSVFLQEGVIVTLTIKRYRGVTTVDFSELGIDDSSDEKLKSFLSEYIQPGQKRLIPPEIEGQLKSIETSARTNLKERSFDCSAFASSGKFVPKSMYPEFKAINEELSDRFYAIRDNFAENYDTIIAQVRKDYKVLAEKLYMQSHPDAKKPSPKYVNAFVDKIIEQIPTADEIVASFEYSTVLRRIPDYLLRVISKKNDIDARVMRIAASNQPKEEPKKKAPAKKAAPKKIESADDIIAMDIQKSVDDQSADMANDFVADIQMRLRTMAYDGASALVKSIEKNNGKLVGRASIGAQSLISDLSKMNFYGDKELEKMVETLAAAMGTDKNERDVAEVKKAAAALMEWSQSSMDDIHSQTVARKVANKPAKKGSARSTASKSTSKTTSKSSSKPASSKTTSKKKGVQITVPQSARSRRSIKQRN